MAELPYIEPDETEEAQTFDLGALPTITHSFDHIVGNQLMCSAHDMCTSVTVSPTAVLEPNEKGELVLVEKAVR
jgi:hypothetical protein